MSNLIGPKPNDTPAYPTPWHNEGEKIVDANGREIAIVSPFGAPAPNKMQDSVGSQVARMICVAVNNTYNGKGWL